MRIKIVSIEGNLRIRLPKDFASSLGLKPGMKVAVKCNGHGLVVCRPSVFDEIDAAWEQMDDDLRVLWGLKVKAAQPVRKQP